MEMNPIDFLIVVILLFTTISGYRKGAARDLIQFIIWIPMFILTALVLLTGEVTNQSSMDLLGTASIIFMVSIMAVWIFDRVVIIPLLQNTFGHKGLIWNKILGVISGGMKGFTVILFYYLCLVIYTNGDLPFKEQMEESIAIPYISPLSDKIEIYLEEQGYLASVQSKDEHWKMGSEYKEDAQNRLTQALKKMFGQ